MTTAIDWDNWGVTEAAEKEDVNNLIISNNVDMDQSGQSDFWNNYGDYSHYSHYFEDYKENLL